jgi:hypothetical protein
MIRQLPPRRGQSGRFFLFKLNPADAHCAQGNAARLSIYLKLTQCDEQATSSIDDKKIAKRQTKPISVSQSMGQFIHASGDIV